MSGEMFRETFEWGLNFPCTCGGYSIPIRVDDDNGYTNIVEVVFSPKQFQELLHQLAQEKFMEYDEESGLSFKCHVTVWADEDGGLKFDVA